MKANNQPPRLLENFVIWILVIWKLQLSWFVNHTSQYNTSRFSKSWKYREGAQFATVNSTSQIPIFREIYFSTHGPWSAKPGRPRRLELRTEPYVAEALIAIEMYALLQASENEILKTRVVSALKNLMNSKRSETGRRRVWYQSFADESWCIWKETAGLERG